MISNYPGAKNGSGIIPFLINNIPYHEMYFELFAGSAQLFNYKKKAKRNVLNDIDKSVYKDLQSWAGAEIFNWDWQNVINTYDFNREDFIYLDPPYPMQARRN